jgi:hypothetical protein
MREGTVWNIVVFSCIVVDIWTDGLNHSIGWVVLLLIVLMFLALTIFHKTVAILESLDRLEQGQSSLHTRLLTLQPE